MNTILSKNINKNLYNHQIPNDFSKFIQSFLITELGDEMKQEKTKENKHQFYTYPIYEVINAIAEYIKFIILNDSRGNYNIKRGFSYEEDIINSKENYCRYLKYIFDKMKINLDYSKIQKQIGKRRLIQGDARYTNLIYEFLQDDILDELKTLKENGLIELSTNKIYLTKYDETIEQQGLKYDGITEYNNIPNAYKEIYYCMKELNDLHRVKHIDSKDSNKIKETKSNLSLYFNLWYATKYARAKNRGASQEELKEIETEYIKFNKNKEEKNIKKLQELTHQFLIKDYEIGD